MKMTNIDFFEFVYLWMYLQGLGVKLPGGCPVFGRRRSEGAGC